jgi:hypothetical protein
MHSFTEPNLASTGSTLRAAIDSAHDRASKARRLAASILETAVRLYSQEGSVRGWLWRYAG